MLTSSRGYAVLFAGVVAALSTGAGYAFVSILLPPKSAIEAGEGYVVRRWEQIRPTAADYERYESENKAWRAKHVTPGTTGE